MELLVIGAIILMFKKKHALTTKYISIIKQAFFLCLFKPSNARMSPLKLRY